MHISVPDHELQDVLSCEDKLRRRFGKEKAENLMQRISELFASASFQDFCSLPQAQFRLLNGNRNVQVALNLLPPLELVIAPAEEPTPEHPDGTPNWRAVTDIKILDVIESKPQPTS